MDRPSRTARGFLRWLPRTRGDGPSGPPSRSYRAQAPPHARGWTPSAWRCWRWSGGSPARAGMDLGYLDTVGYQDGLPRTRGDGPCSEGERSAFLRAPPHARGWTSSVRWAPHSPRGSPARAGMDPTRTRRRHSPVWLPRTRGDGPSSRLESACTKSAPPHARGWTEQARCGTPAGRGSPARAGMDREVSDAAWASSWLPRTRGDGPLGKSKVFRGLAAPPHARGWTPGRHRRRLRHDGSPARAGMDQMIEVVPAVTIGLPRTRGDGPTITFSPS